MSKAKAKVMEKELAPKAKAKSAAPPPVSANGASVDDRMEAGRALRETVPRVSHADFWPAPDRPNPIVLLQEQAADRVADLVPIRYGRMVSSPFAFLRGSAAVMAEDLASTPRTGIDVQACGDAHLGNFGVFATPERNVVFDLNDFDETLPGPWEWDLKRLAASVVVACRHRGFTAQAGRAAVTAMVRTYSLRLRELAVMGHLEVWYNRIDAEQLLAAVSGTARKSLQKGLAKAESRTTCRPRRS